MPLLGISIKYLSLKNKTEKTEQYHTHLSVKNKTEEEKTDREQYHLSLKVLLFSSG